MMLIGCGTGVAVGIGVKVAVSVKTGVDAAVAVCVEEGRGGFAGGAVCTAQAERKTANTNKVFFITKLLPIKKTTGDGLLPPPVC
jgi:hypothetical protein